MDRQALKGEGYIRMETLDTKEMKKLSRSEMLEMMLLQSNEIEKLQAEVAELTAKLNDRSIAVDKAGTLAEASILISNVLQEADRAAKDYLINIERLSGDADRVSQAKIAEAQLKADALLMEAKGKAAALLSQAQTALDKASGEAEQAKADVITKARQEANAIVSRASVERDRIKREADTYWVEVSAKMEAFYQEHKGLREMLSSFGGTMDK